MTSKNIPMIYRAVSPVKGAVPRTACSQTSHASALQKSIARAVRSTPGVAIAAAALYATEATATGADSIEVGTASAPGDIALALAIGAQATATGNSSLAVGLQANAQNDDAIAVGSVATAQGDGAVAIGPSSPAQGEGASAFASYSNAQAARATAVGLNASALGVDSVATRSPWQAARTAVSRCSRSACRRCRIPASGFTRSRVAATRAASSAPRSARGCIGETHLYV